VTNNPATFTDPSGEFWQLAIYGVAAYELIKLAFFDNVRELSDDGVGGETDTEYWAKVTTNTSFWGIGYVGGKYLEPVVGKIVHPSYPRLGRKPKFPNEAWWFGVRQRIAISNLYVDRFITNPALEQSRDWFWNQMRSTPDYSNYLCVSYTYYMCYQSKK
jgi:hypothetical protein